MKIAISINDGSGFSFNPASTDNPVKKGLFCHILESYWFSSKLCFKTLFRHIQFSEEIQ